jgi:8-amino-7-oxononanoate synthase
MGSLDRFAAEKLSALAARSLKRELTTTARGHAAASAAPAAAAPETETPGGSVAQVLRAGRRMVSFSCNDYLNLSTHPDIVAAAVDATRRYGVGAGGSRAVTGNHPLYAVLEAKLAARKGSEAAVVFGSGYLANSGLIPALLTAEDLLLVDKLAHSCIWAGAKLSGARVVAFPHNDLRALEASLRAERAGHRHAMIVTETVFSMDGDCAPLAAIADLADAYDAWGCSDDAHGLGVVPTAAGARRFPLQMGTLSKAVGAYGGYVCTTADVAALLRNRARSFVYSTGLPPATIAAAIAALDFLDANPDHCARPLANARRFTSALGLPPATSPIVPVIVGEAAAALTLSERLAESGFLVAAIRPPTVPPGTARLRVAFSAAHTDAEVDALAARFQELKATAAS